MEKTDNQSVDAFDELLKISEQVDFEYEIAEIVERSDVELKSVEFWPIFDEYYGSAIVNRFSYSDGERLSQKAAKRKLKDPKGGLTAAGRAYFKRTEGANLKPGVKGPADTPEKMRRKGSFLTRFFTNPSGPLVDEKGRATRLALSAAAWGEPVPKTAADAAKLAAKGRRLLERYAKSKKEKTVLTSDFEYKAALNGVMDVEPDMQGIGIHSPLDAERGIEFSARRRHYVIQQMALRNVGKKQADQEYPVSGKANKVAGKKPKAKKKRTSGKIGDE